MRVFAFMSFMAIAASAAAVPATYTSTFVANGSLNGSSFTGATVTISMLTDTANFVDYGVPAPNSLHFVTGTSSVSVAGIGTDFFDEETWAYTIHQEGFGSMNGFAWNDGFVIIGALGPAFDNYDLLASNAPLSGSGLINSSLSFTTVNGSFNVSSIAGDATFSSSVEAVPEPASMAALGLGAVALVRRRRKS